MIARWLPLLTHLSLVLGTPAAPAQIVTDGTVGPAMSLSGSEMTIGAELGSTRGGNLFHSFQRFDIQSGQTAAFTGPEQIQNVIGRVTGGQTSRIDGTLCSTVGQADVYLINPSGIVMGPNARVDVPAALHLSTADELRFSDGRRYSASDPANSTLTLATPESFGFLSPQPASLTITGSQLELRPGKAATLTAGDIRISGTDEQRAMLSVPDGRLRIEAVGTMDSEVPVWGVSLNPGGLLSVEQARIQTSGDSGGSLSVRAGELRMSESTVQSNHWGDRDHAAGIDLMIRGLAMLTRGTSIRSDALGTGRAGQVNVAAGRLEMREGSWISSSSFDAGDGGTVTIQADTMHLQGVGEDEQATGLFSAAFSETGAGGEVNLKVQGVSELIDGARISAGTYGAGHAGAVSVETEALRLLNGASISSGTSGGRGAGGRIRVQAETAYLDGSGIYGTANEDATGRAGDIAVTIDGSLEMVNRAVIDGSSYDATGDAGDIRIQADALSFTSASRITTEAEQNHAGRIEIRGGRLWLTDSLITTTANGAIGDGGNIGITPEYLILDGGFIQANTAAPRARGGDIRIDSRALVASEGLVEIGGAERQDFAVSRGRNIIQAAAPGGEQGTIDVTSPDLDITAALVPLAAAFDDPDDLLTDLCQGVVTGSAASSLVERGAGGLPRVPGAPASVSFTDERLDRVRAP
jgi:filamentous hemagglutinin family protein